MAVQVVIQGAWGALDAWAPSVCLALTSCTLAESGRSKPSSLSRSLEGACA